MVDGTLEDSAQEIQRDPEPRWPALVGLGAVTGLHLALPSTLTLGPEWLLPAIVVALMTPAVVARRRNAKRLANVLGHATVSLLTLDLAASLALLISRLPQHKESPRGL